MILITFILTALILAGVFYWINNTKFNQLANSSPQPSQNQAAGGLLPQSLENEISTSSPPFVAKGEILQGNPNKKQIIFTFDGGSGINSAQKIMDVAAKHSVNLTFFSTGKFAQKYPELIKQIAAAGHEIFNHTYSHPLLTQLSDEQIEEELIKCEDIIYGLTGQTTKPYFRPPYGDRNEHVLQVASAIGYQSVYWTTDSFDWMTGKTAQEVKQRIYDNLKPGAIFLMHVGDEITGNVLDEVFTYVENQGYKIVSLSEGLK